MRFKTVFLIVLISILLLSLGLSIDSANALLSVKNAYGQAGIIGYRSIDDSITINLTSTDNNLTVENADNSLCSCNINGIYWCVCGVADHADAPSVTYTIKNSKGDSAVASIDIDNSIGDVEFTLSNNGTTILNYNVIDTSYNGASECSGIQRIDIYDSSDNINSLYINGTSNTCTYSGSVALNIVDSGQKDLYIIATDNLGNTKESTHQNITLDVEPPDISQIEIKSLGNDLDTISTGNDIPVEIYFQIIEDSLASISADLSSINYNPAIQQTYASVQVPINECTENTSSDGHKIYSCAITDKILRLNNPVNSMSPTINISITAKDTSGNLKTQVFEKTFNVDNQKSKGLITTDHCDKNGQCFVKDGLNNILVTLEKQNFNNNNVYVNIAGRSFRSENCTGNLCTIPAILTCNSGSMLETSIDPSSIDDSGNPVINVPTSLYCDNTAPIILNISFSGNYYQGLVISGSDVTINATIKEDDTDDVNASVFLPEMKNDTEIGTCSRNSDNLLYCTWSVNNINSGFYDANIIMTITDAAGNSASKTATQRVLDIKSDNETPHSMRADFLHVYPQSIDRITVDLASNNNIPYFIFAQYQINSKIGNKAQLNFQRLLGCTYEADTGDKFSEAIFSSIQITDPSVNAGITGRIDFQFDKNIRVNDLPNLFYAYCNISAYVQEDKFVYKNPQNLVLKIPFQMRNSKLGTPGQALQDKISREEDGFAYKFQLLGIVNSWLPKIQKLCQIKDYFNMGLFGANIISAAGDIVKPVVGPGMMNAGGAMYFDIHKAADCVYGDQSNSVSTQSGSSQTSPGACSNVVKTVCDFLSCNVAEKYDETKAGTLTNIFNGTDLLDNGILKNANMPDVSNSIVAAVGAQCWPAVIYNVDKYRQVDCGYVYCLKEAAIQGTDISVCDTAKSIQTCSLVVGEAFEVVSPIRWTKNVMNNIGEIINGIGPLAAVSVAKLTYCQDYMNSNGGSPGGSLTNFDSTKIYVCQIPLQIARFIDGMKRSTKAEGFNYPEITDMCQLAQCVGQPGCEDNSNIWKQLNNIQIPKPNLNGRDYSYVANHHKILDDLIDQKTQLLSDKNIAQEYKATREVMFGKSNQVILPPNPDVQKALDIDKNIDIQNGLIRCGQPSCDPAKTTDLGSLTPAQRDARMQQLDEGYETAAKDYTDANERLNSPTSSMMLTNQELLDLNNRVKKDLVTLGKCSDTQTCDPKTSTWTKQENDALNQRLHNYKVQQQVKQFGDGVYIGLQVLYNNHMLDWMMSANWGSSALKVVQFFDSEKWKENLCNPDVRIAGGVNSDTGNVISCNGGSCQPVLTMAAEREKFIYSNGTQYYIYTIAYYIGPVKTNPNVQINYNVQFNGNSGSVNGYAKSLSLGNGATASFQKAFASNNYYDTICIVFDQDYPQNLIGAKDKYCRSIKVNDFNTGLPGSDTGSTSYSYNPNTGNYQNSGYQNNINHQTTGNRGVLE